MNRDTDTVPARHATPDVAELRRLRDTEREELHSPTRRLDAYYYSFNETGSVPIDAILSAVAIAGKSCHNTDRWTEDDEWSRWGVGRSLVDVIQCAANEAAAALLNAAAERDRLVEAVARVRALHRPVGIYDECECSDEAKAGGHEDVEDIGLTCNRMYTVCAECCRDDVYQTEDCANYHDHKPDEAHHCPTIRALDEEADA